MTRDELLDLFRCQKSMVNELSHQYDLMQDKKKLELLLKELNKSEQWHRSLFDSATDGIIVLDRNGVILKANASACMRSYWWLSSFTMLF
jgi:PAS domain-containing protein